MTLPKIYWGNCSKSISLLLRKTSPNLIYFLSNSEYIFPVITFKIGTHVF